MFTRFQENDIVNPGPNALVTSTWSDNTNNLQVAHTSSIQAVFTSPSSSGQFFIEVLQKESSESDAEIQYAIAYGNRVGSGSPDFTNDTGSFGNSPSKVIYNQYRQLVFNDETQNFTFGTHTPDSIFVININRARYKQSLTLGSLNLHISGTTNGYDDQTIIHLTDDSVTNGQTGDSNLGPQYNIVSGSNGVLSGSFVNQVGASASYGLFYPNAGVIILNGDVFSGSLTPQTASGEFAKYATTGINTNHQKLYKHISSSNGAGAGHFIVDTTEEISSKFYFVRARNNEYNYSNNESFKDANNNVRFTSMQANPKVFITTVGLYNNANELLAIAKLSQPVAKDFTKEALIRVKLDY